MELALDFIIIILIAVMIAYGLMLNGKLKAFRSAQDDMAVLVRQLNEAVSQAQAGIANLKEAARTEESRLESLIKKSRLLVDELEIITESGSNLADRIERGLVPSEITADDYDEENPEEYGEEENYEMLEKLKKIR